MESRREGITAAALSLPEGERARLADQLITSLPEDSEIGRAWVVEVRERLERYRADEIETAPAREVFEEARERTRPCRRARRPAVSRSSSQVHQPE